jgi:hypothetical protein
VSDPRFIGLIASLRSSAQAALGETDSPMLHRLARDGALQRRTAERALALLDMLAEKTHGNLDETERAALHDARTALHARLDEVGDARPAEAPDETGRERGPTN